MTIKQGADGLYDIYETLAGGEERLVDWGYGSMNSAQHVVNRLRKSNKRAI